MPQAGPAGELAARAGRCRRSTATALSLEVQLPSARRSPLALLLVSLAACGLLEPDGGRVTVRFEERAPLLRERLVVSVTDADNQWYLEGSDLVDDADGWLSSRALRVRTPGQLRLTATLQATQGGVASSGEVILPLDDDARWRVDIFPSARSPAVACGRCAGVQRFPIATGSRPSAQDWLYITWTEPASEP